MSRQREAYDELSETSLYLEQYDEAALKEQGLDNSPNPAESYAVKRLKQIKERFRNR